MRSLTKTCLIAAAVAAASFSPTLALAVDSADIDACMQRFTQEYFPSSHVTYVAPEQPNLLLPLALNHGTHDVAVTVTSAKTGAVLAYGVCAVSDSPKRSGYVIVSETPEKE